MKKQINPSIKAHLLWSALILLALFAVCALPFALAQSRSRGTSKQSEQFQKTQPAFQTINTYAGMPVGTAGPVTVTATCGVIGPTNYPTLKDAFEAINAGTHQCDIIIDIVSSTVEGSTPATLNGSGAGPALYTSVLIRPVNDGVSVSGNPASGLGVVQLNGASTVTIDGDNPNTPGINRNLTIQNTATNTTTYGQAVRIALATSGNNHADNDTIKNLNLIGSATAGAVDQVYSCGVTAQGSGTTAGLIGVIRGNIIYVEGWIGAGATTSSANSVISIGGISATGTYTVEKNKVSRARNNNQATFAAVGINLSGGNNHVIKNNFVFDVRN